MKRLMRALGWSPRPARVAQDKRRLEQLLRDEGLSRTQAQRVVSRYFEGVAQ